MKKFLFALAAGLIPALAAINGVYAQNSVNTEVPEPQKNVAAIREAVSLVNDHMVDIAATSPKALKSFTKTYKNVTGENWTQTRNGFSAKFNLDGVTNIIYYGRSGKWMGSLKNYFEDKLPAAVRKIVKREYYDYSITYVQEGETNDSDGTPTYIIHLEDKNHIKLVRVCDGQMDVWKEYQKQS